MDPSTNINGGDKSDGLLAVWSNIDHWQKLCPYLTISETIKSDGVGSGSAGGCGAKEGKLLERLIGDGYALLDKKMLFNDGLIRGITELETKHSLPATFILLFDEVWEMAAESYHLLLGKDRKGGVLQPSMMFNFDMLAWYIDPRVDQAGFSPHRDRQPESVRELDDSFYPNGQAKYVTNWISLTDATPENSCLYVIPKGCDPGYAKGDFNALESDDCDKKFNGLSKVDEQHLGPLQRALSTKQSYQSIRAIPRQAGQSVIFTHRILHWGSKGNKYALGVQPRIAISFVYSDAEFEAPYLSEESYVENRKGPPFSTRLLLVCGQLLIYYQRFNLPAKTLRACYDYCKANSGKLNDVYRKKVFVEYVKAMKEARDGILTEEGSKCDLTNNQEVDSDDEEALLDEMLNHSDEFDDDYDDMCSDCDGNGRAKKRKLSR